MKLVITMRTKNEGLMFEKCLEKFSSLADEMIVLDNGSTNGTLEICNKFPKIKKIIVQDDSGNYHAGRDLNLLLEEAKKRNPDWIMWACADELFEDHLTREVMERYMRGPYDRITFRMCNFWLSTKYFRFDRDWFRNTLMPQRMMWRNLEGTYYKNEVLHPGDIRGIHSKIYISPYRIKHYGYAFREEIAEKTRVYRLMDQKKRISINMILAIRKAR